MDKVDGGMARKRWERKNGQISRRAVGEIKRVPAASKAVQSPPPPSRRHLFTQGRTHTSHASRLPTDGALSGSGGSGDEGGDCVIPLDSTIYVSILDPLGEPAFKPSPTKPIPRWMQWLPSKRDHSRRKEPQSHSILDEYFPPHPVASSNEAISTLRTFCPTSPTQAQPYPEVSARPPSHCHTPHSSEYGNLGESAIIPLKGPSFVIDEPLKRPSSRLTHSTQNSPRTNTTLGESVASSTPLETLPPRSRSPYAPRRPSPLGMREEQHDSGDRDSSWKYRLRRPSSPLADQVAAHLQRYIRRTPPAQSREFINLYRPMQPSSPSVAVAGRDRDKAVGDGRRIRNMLSRQRTPSPLGGYATGGDGGGEQIVTGSGDVVDIRSVRKRSSLQSEIKKLLSGRALGRGE
ncbi:hypothetical protein F5Y05DRAFT_362526 [Hypoxylon sp. FL0543]|nr:hypothetical protein F5Y05DRAFT_362526 [Hypoxylon sp. FL0543]